ncbi:hypothetical protein E8E11_009385 [Didymella keratinophila]|nr:hypothetical protein E8E11_009385 [Didymella keratinophila]
MFASVLHRLLLFLYVYPGDPPPSVNYDQTQDRPPSILNVTTTMKAFTILVALAGFVTVIVAAPSPQIPTCTFDPVKGEHICLRDVAPPICRFDPVKGEYVCPPSVATDFAISANNDATLVDLAAASCGQEGLRKCTRERQDSVCENSEWKLVHRCATGQQCDI